MFVFLWFSLVCFRFFYLFHWFSWVFHWFSLVFFTFKLRVAESERFLIKTLIKKWSKRVPELQPRIFRKWQVAKSDRFPIKTPIIPASTQNIEFRANYRNTSLSLKSGILPFCFNGLGVAQAAPRPKHERTYHPQLLPRAAIRSPNNHRNHRSHP